MDGVWTRRGESTEAAVFSQFKPCDVNDITVGVGVVKLPSNQGRLRSTGGLLRFQLVSESPAGCSCLYAAFKEYCVKKSSKASLFCRCPIRWCAG